MSTIERRPARILRVVLETRPGRVHGRRAGGGYGVRLALVGGEEDGSIGGDSGSVAKHFVNSHFPFEMAGASIESRALGGDLIEAGAVAGIQLLQKVARALDGDVMRVRVDVFVGIDLVLLCWERIRAVRCLGVRRSAPSLRSREYPACA